METYDLNCPKGYGKINFIGKKDTCPVSGAVNCVECDIIQGGETKDGQVKRKEEK